MNAPRNLPGRGASIGLELRDRRGNVREELGVPEDQLAAALGSLSEVAGREIPFDPYGDTILSHERCGALVQHLPAALAAVKGRDTKTCAEAVLRLIEHAGTTPGACVVLIGN